MTLYYYNAYQDLSTCRMFAEGYIPWVAIVEYANHTRHDIDDLAFVVLNTDDRLRKVKGPKSDDGPSGLGGTNGADSPGRRASSSRSKERN